MNVNAHLRVGVVICCLALLPLPDWPAPPAKESQDPTFKIEVKVNKALVPVVVRDAKGHAVSDLKKEDFVVFDRGKPRSISGFTVEERGAAEKNAKSNNNPSAPSANASPTPSTSPERFIVILFDDLHLSAGDLGQVQLLGLKMLASSLTESDRAAVVSLSGANSGLTRDRAKLEEAVKQLKAQPLYRLEGLQCPEMDYYTADLIANKHNSMALEASIRQTLDCANLDPRTMRNVAENLVRSGATHALTVGDQDIRTTFGALGEFVKRMGSLPGERIVILVSPGFLTITAEALSEESRLMDLAAQSNVTISALDARGLYTTELDASERGSGSPVTIQLKSENRRSSMSLGEDVMRELADGTGGTYFHNSNDLEAGLKGLIAAPEYVYVLEIPLDEVKPDGSYHALKVKVDREGLHLQARRGYFAPKPEKTKK